MRIAASDRCEPEPKAKVAVVFCRLTGGALAQPLTHSRCAEFPLPSWRTTSQGNGFLPIRRNMFEGRRCSAWFQAGGMAHGRPNLTDPRSFAFLRQSLFAWPAASPTRAHAPRLADAFGSISRVRGLPPHPRSCGPLCLARILKANVQLGGVGRNALPGYSVSCRPPALLFRLWWDKIFGGVSHDSHHGGCGALHHV